VENKSLWAQLILGLLIFSAGIVLLICVFVWSYQLYQGIDAQLLQVSAVKATPQVAGAPPNTKTLPPGALQSNPKGPKLTSIALALAVKFLALLVMGWIAGLISSKGVSLAVGVTRRSSPPSVE